MAAEREAGHQLETLSKSCGAHDRLSYWAPRRKVTTRGPFLERKISGSFFSESREQSLSRRLPTALCGVRTPPRHLHLRNAGDLRLIVDITEKVVHRDTG